MISFVMLFNILFFCLVCPSVCYLNVPSSIKTFNGTKGTFSSEKRSDNLYPLNISVEYKIEVSSGRRAMLSFTTFSVLGLMPNCTEDSVEVFVGCQKRRSVGKYCSCGLVSHLPFDFYSIDECITLIFKSDATYAAQGFDVVYSSAPKNQSLSNKNVCMSMGNTSKNIFTPMWPNNYPTNSNCTWTAETPDNYTTIIQFMDFAIEKTVFCYPNEEKDDRVMIKASKSKVISSPDIEVIERRICSQIIDIDTRKIFKVVVPQAYRRIYVDFVNDQDNHTSSGIAAGLVSYMSGPPEQILKSCLASHFMEPPSSAAPEMLSTNLLFLLTFTFFNFHT